MAWQLPQMLHHSPETDRLGVTPFSARKARMNPDSLSNPNRPATAPTVACGFRQRKAAAH